MIKFRKLIHHFGVRRYLANVSWLFFGQMFYLLLSFIVGAWVARYLGPEKYGLANYVMSFVGLFSFIVAIGTDGVLNRELVSHPEKRDILLGTTFRLRLLGGVVAFLVTIVTAFLLSNHNYLWFSLVVLYSLNFFLQAPYIISNFFFSEVQAKKSVQAQFYVTLISSSLKIILILFSGGVAWLLLIYVLDCLWQSIALFLLYHQQKFKVSSWRFQPELARQIWHDSWPLMLSSAAYLIYLRIDQVMVGRIIDESAVGIYAVAVRVTEIFYFIPTIICGSLFPAIINARKVSPEVFKKRLKYFYLLLGLAGLIVASSVSLLARTLIVSIFGSAYSPSILILKIYIWSSIGLFIGLGVNQQLTIEHKTKTIFSLNLVAMFTNIGLNFLLIPRAGLAGAAIATLISYSVVPFGIGCLRIINYPCRDLNN